MNVLAVGLDVVEIPRVARLLERHAERAVRHLLTEDERRYCLGQARAAQHVAVRIAAKEAAYKALASGVDHAYIPWRDVEVLRGRGGNPSLRLHGRARTAAARLGVTDALVSLTHTATHAAVVVILVGIGRNDSA